MTTDKETLGKLKPCPFCGSTDIATDGASFTQFMCNRCGAATYDQDGHAEAIAAWNRRAPRIDPGSLSDQVILELRAVQHVLGYPDALGDAIEAISGIEEERVRLWNEVRDLKSSLNVEKATTDTMRTERDAASILIDRLIKWDSEFPVNSHNGYAGLKELDRIIADGRALIGASDDDL